MKKEQLTIPFEERLEFADKYEQFDKKHGNNRREKWSNLCLQFITICLPITVSLPFATNFVLPAIISSILFAGCGVFNFLCYREIKKDVKIMFDGKITYKQLKQLEKSGEVAKCLELAMVHDLASDFEIKEEDKPIKRVVHYIEKPYSDHYIFTEDKNISQNSDETQK